MKRLFLTGLIVLVSCSEKQEIHAPVSGTVEQKKPSVSQERAKNLNEMERQQIAEWIAGQDKEFIQMPLNYWVDIPDFKERNRKGDDETVSYMYDQFDFAGEQLYEKPKGYRDVPFRKFPNEIRAVEDALRYLKTGEEATLLVPSVLAYGTYGDGDRITNDLPLIIKIKAL